MAYEGSVEKKGCTDGNGALCLMGLTDLFFEGWGFIVKTSDQGITGL
jgi:hypothetical protein